MGWELKRRHTFILETLDLYVLFEKKKTAFLQDQHTCMKCNFSPYIFLLSILILAYVIEFPFCWSSHYFSTLIFNKLSYDTSITHFKLNIWEKSLWFDIPATVLPESPITPLSPSFSVENLQSKEEGERKRNCDLTDSFTDDPSLTLSHLL